MVLTTSKFTEDCIKVGMEGHIIFNDLLLGLLVLSTGTPGEYRRAGLFFTEADGPCGVEFWNQCETREVRLI
jgi:hypothetical protein